MQNKKLGSALANVQKSPFFHVLGEERSVFRRESQNRVVIFLVRKLNLAVERTRSKKCRTRNWGVVLSQIFKKAHFFRF